MAKARSPSYPSISLEEAVEKISRVYHRDYQNAISRELVAQHMGYHGINGKSLGILAAVTKYGLLEGRGNETRVSDLGVKIIAHEPGSPDRIEALREAAQRPELFNELDQRFSGGKGSDQAIRAYLLMQKFIPAGADIAIRAYRDTKRFLEMEGAAEIIENADKDSSAPTALSLIPMGGNIIRPAASSQIGDKTDSVFRVGLSDDRLDVSAVLLDAESVDKLIRALQANRALLPEKKAPKATEEEMRSLGLLE